MSKNTRKFIIHGQWNHTIFIKLAFWPRIHRPRDRRCEFVQDFQNCFDPGPVQSLDTRPRFSIFFFVPGLVQGFIFFAGLWIPTPHRTVGSIRALFQYNSIRICALRHIILYYFINLWDWAPRRAIARCQKHHFQAEKLSLAPQNRQLEILQIVFLQRYCEFSLKIQVGSAWSGIHGPPGPI